MDCPNCGKDVDNLAIHNKQFHESLEIYATEVKSNEGEKEELDNLEDEEVSDLLADADRKSDEAKATERSKSEIQKEIDDLQEYINVASFENPLNMGDSNEKLSALQVEWANATEEYEEYKKEEDEEPWKPQEEKWEMEGEDEAEEGGQGSGPQGSSASLPEQVGRDPALHYDPFEKEQDPLQTDPSLRQLKDSEFEEDRDVKTIEDPDTMIRANPDYKPKPAMEADEEPEEKKPRPMNADVEPNITKVSPNKTLIEPAEETTIDKCIVCGRTADNHSNPNTDYRGLHGDAPPTDHYYSALDDGVEALATEDTDDYEVDVDEYISTGEPVQKIPEDKRAEEIEHQEDKPEMSQKEWDEDLAGLKDEYATEEDKENDDNLVIDNDEDLFALHKGIMDKPVTEACQVCGGDHSPATHGEDKKEATEDDYPEEPCAKCGVQYKDHEEEVEDHKFVEPRDLASEVDEREMLTFLDSKASNVDNIIGDVQEKFNLTRPEAEEIVDKWDRIRHGAEAEEELSEFERSRIDLREQAYGEQSDAEKKANEDETETSDDGTDISTPMTPDVDDSDTDAVATFTMESWDGRVPFNTKVEAFEALGITQGDSLKLAELNWRELSIEVRGTLNEFADNDKEEKRVDSQDAFNDEGDGVGSQPDTQIKDLDSIDYNIIDDNTVAREKYQCEHCNSEFKSNEALMIHFNDIHIPAREFLLDVPNSCTYCGQEIPANVSMGEHLAYEHGISLDVKLENGMVTDGPVEPVTKTIDLNEPPIETPVEEPLITEAEGGWDECQDCNFIGNTTEDTNKHKQETGHNTEHFGFQNAMANEEEPDPDHMNPTKVEDYDYESDKPETEENLKKKIKSNEVRATEGEDYKCQECGKEFNDEEELADHSSYEHSIPEFDNLGGKPETNESWKPHVYKATEAVSYAEEEFKEDEHPREDSGKFTSGGGGAKTQTKDKPKSDTKSKKLFDKAKTRAMKGMKRPDKDDNYGMKQWNQVNNLDGFPTHSSQLRGAGVSIKAPIMKAHLQSVYPDNNWSVKTEYFSMGSAIRAGWKGGGKYPYGASKNIGQLYSNHGASNMQVDYSDTDNYVDLHDNRAEYFGGDGNHDMRDPQTLADSRQDRLRSWLSSGLREVDYNDLHNWSKSVAEDLVKTGKFTPFQGMTDEHKAYFNKTWNEFQEIEKKEGGIGEIPNIETPEATTPAFHTQQYMGEDPNKPSEIPFDPKTGKELPVSKFRPKLGDYTKHDVTKSTPDDVEKARKQMQRYKDTGEDQPEPWQKSGEAIEDPYSELNPDNKCGMCGKTFDTRQDLEDHVYGLGPHNKTTVESYATEIEHEKCPDCNFETSWKEGDDWQKDDARGEMDRHINSKHGTEATEDEDYVGEAGMEPMEGDDKIWEEDDPNIHYDEDGNVIKANEGLKEDVEDNWNYGTNQQEILAKSGVDNKWVVYPWNELPKSVQDQIITTAASYESFVAEDDPDFENDPDYQGFVDGKKKEPSQYTQQGIADAMADPDWDKLDEVIKKEGV